MPSKGQNHPNRNSHSRAGHVTSWLRILAGITGALTAARELVGALIRLLSR